MTMPPWITHLVIVNEKGAHDSVSMLKGMPWFPWVGRPCSWPLYDHYRHTLSQYRSATFLVSSAVVLLSNYIKRSYFWACGFVRCFDKPNCTHSDRQCLCGCHDYVKQVKLSMAAVTELLFCHQLFTLKWPRCGPGEHAVAIVTTSSPLSD